MILRFPITGWNISSWLKSTLSCSWTTMLFVATINSEWATLHAAHTSCHSWRWLITTSAVCLKCFYILSVFPSVIMAWIALILGPVWNRPNFVVSFCARTCYAWLVWHFIRLQFLKVFNQCFDSVGRAAERSSGIPDVTCSKSMKCRLIKEKLTIRCSNNCGSDSNVM